MASTVTSRPTYYDVLGLKPTATVDEIARAFVQSLSMFRPTPFGRTADIGIAYETLRNPEKRRAYDASIGLAAEPIAPPAPRFVSSGVVTASAQRSNPFAAPKLAPQPKPEVAPEPGLGSFIASSLREQVAAPYAPPPPAAEEPEVVQPAEDRVERIEIPSVWHSPEPAADLEEQGIDWKRTGIAIGAVVLAVGVIGGWAGWNAGQDVEEAKATGAVTVALPQPKTPAPVTAVAAAPAPRLGDLLPDRHTQAFVAPRHHERTPYVAQALPVTSPVAQEAKPESSGFQEIAANQAVTEAPTVSDAPIATVAPASMPLPNKVIARTIHRIGYACGDVASTTAVEGAAGVFNVTCTSGQTYQASPVRGRYHFRKVGGH
jgi:hypothetical protein